MQSFLSTSRERPKVLPFPVRQAPNRSRVAPSPVRVFIVDDQSLVRRGVRLFLESDPEIQIVGEAKNAADGLALVRELKPDVVLMDVMMPETGGIAATVAIRRAVPTAEVIALSSETDPSHVAQMIRAGAVGFLAKDTSATELCRAIHGAAVGQVQLAPNAAAILMGEMREPEVELFSSRELEVLALMTAGQSNKEIGRALSIEASTVKTHVSNILAKLGVESRTQAALVALDRGHVSPIDAANAS
jgi:NarL family two-component system response regulator LiaR